jgi:phosphonate degradation associated HDIG domain protein
MHPSHLLERIDDLFGRHGCLVYGDARHEPVTALQHALQCAQLAEWAHAHMPLVGAALLHDIGHLLVADELADDIDDGHELLAVPFLSTGFGPELVDPVALHVAAKRYLVFADRKYAATLSPASLHSLALQGGPMSSAEAAAYESQPHAMEAVRLRRWDDLAKMPGKKTPRLDYYLVLLEQVLLEPAVPA